MEINEKRKALIETARKYIGAKFSDQGRNRRNGFDCGGLVMVSAREVQISELEFLGYANFPTDGKFDELLAEHCELLFKSRYPHSWSGEEAIPGDLFSFDYENGEGTRHLGLVTKFERGRYFVIDAINDFGVTEHAVALEFAKATISIWRVKGIDD